MAIDTAEKRRAVGGIPFLPLGPNVTPNVAKDAEWRQQVAWSYSGIAITASTGASIEWLFVSANQRDMLIHRRRRKKH